MKHLKALFVLALVVAVAAPAYAETQNVKVSGSIDMYHFYRSNWDLRDNNDSGAVPQVGNDGGFPAPFDSDVRGENHGSSPFNRSEGDDYFMTVTQIEVSADLTDNVSTVINIVNQRDWNAGTDEFSHNPSDGEEFDIELDLAYVQMKEIFYSPLTLTIGRQDLWFGRGLVVGSNWRSWDNQSYEKFASGQIQADEYSAKTAFDSIRATLDFNPWTLDFVYSQIDENAHDPEDDISLYVVNVNYKFAEYNAVAELYYVGETDRATVPDFDDTEDSFDTWNNDTHTIGGRVQFDPISQITLGGELAYQFGDYQSPGDDFPPLNEANLYTERDRSALLFNIFGTYRWDYEWKPELTLEYLHVSGEDEPIKGGAGDYNAWNPLYRGKFYTAYADFREFVYSTGDSFDQDARQNENVFQVKGSLRPLEDLLLEASWTQIWTDEDIDVVRNDGFGPFLGDVIGKRDDDIGWEVDLGVTYDYTEDVTFSTLFSWFEPGDYYSGANDPNLTTVTTDDDEDENDSRKLGSDDGAFSIVSSVKVTF
ncbi:MAG: hypothetical protein ACREH5_02225 [Candidatus Omnitrophota bacterium]